MAPSFRSVLRPPRRVRLRTCDDKAEPLSSCLPPCSGRVGRVSEGCWEEEDEAEATAAWVVELRRPTPTTRGAVAAAAVAPPIKEPTTREAPRVACRGAIRKSVFCFLAERERASKLAFQRERELEMVKKK